MRDPQIGQLLEPLVREYATASESGSNNVSPAVPVDFSAEIADYGLNGVGPGDPTVGSYDTGSADDVGDAIVMRADDDTGGGGISPPAAPKRNGDTLLVPTAGGANTQSSGVLILDKPMPTEEEYLAELKKQRQELLSNGGPATSREALGKLDSKIKSERT